MGDEAQRKVLLLRIFRRPIGSPVNILNRLTTFAEPERCGELRSFVYVTTGFAFGNWQERFAR